MTARVLPVRRRLLAAVLLAVLAGEVVWGPGGCDGCASRVQRGGEGGNTP